MSHLKQSNICCLVHYKNWQIWDMHINILFKANYICKLAAGRSGYWKENLLCNFLIYVDCTIDLVSRYVSFLQSTSWKVKNLINFNYFAFFSFINALLCRSHRMTSISFVHLTANTLLMLLSFHGTTEAVPVLHFTWHSPAPCWQEASVWYQLDWILSQ